MDTFINIGFTKKPHGLKGEIKLQIDDKYVEDLLETDVVILTIQGKEIPFFIEDIRIGNNIIGKFEEVDTLEDAQKISSKVLSLREKDILPDELRTFDEEEGLQFEKCVGYMIVNGEEEVGIIDEVQEFPQQEMAILTYDGRDVLIPLHPAFIVKQDDELKKIFMNLPEGLLEL